MPEIPENTSNVPEKSLREQVYEAYRARNVYKNKLRDNKLQGPCPVCGGDDRFYTHPEKGFACNKGCAAKEIVATLGITNTNRRGDTETQYQYRAADGTLVLTVTRTDRADGTKTFRQWPTGLKGGLPLFKLLELPEDLSQPVYVTEGEKACLSLRAHGYAATCWSGGTNAVHKTDFSPLHGRHVVLLADADKPGRKAMRTLAAQLHDHTASLKVHLPAGTSGKDVADYPPAELPGLLDQAENYDTANTRHRPRIGRPKAVVAKVASADSKITVDLATIAGIEYEFRRACGPDFRYDHPTKNWFRKDRKTGLWRPCPKGAVVSMHHEAALQAANREPDLRKSDRKFLMSYRAAKEATEANAAWKGYSVDYAGPDQCIWDQKPELLGTPSGIYDLKTGLPYSGEADPYITMQTSVSPVSEAEYEAENKTEGFRFWPFLLEIFGETNSSELAMVTYMQMVMGYVLTGLIEEHVFWFLYGPGGTGKTTFVEYLTWIMGDYACAVDRNLLLHTKHTQHPEALVKLHRKRLVTTSEVPKNSVLDDGLIKSLTGGESISARAMYGHRFEFYPTHKLFMVGNHQPKLSGGDDSGMKRRLHILPFYHKPDIPDTKLLRKLKAEAPYFLRYLLMCAKSYWHGYESGTGLYDLPAKARTVTDAYFESQDHMGEFIHEYCDLGPELYVFPSRLYEHYKADFKGSLGARNFAVELKAYVDKKRELGEDLGIRKVSKRLEGHTNARMIWTGIQPALRAG